MKNFKLGLVPRLIIAIILGVFIGQYSPLGFVRIFKTFMIVGFVVSGIAKLTEGAGKLLGFTAATAYISTITAGTFSYLVAVNFYPKIISAISSPLNFAGKDVAPYFSIPLKPAFDVTAAIVFAFMMGITISVMRTKNNEGELTFKFY